MMMMTDEVEEKEERSIIDNLKRFLSGFPFHPTGEEEIEEYLKKKLETAPFTINLITEDDLYDLNPWEFTEKFTSNGPNEYYFCTPRDRQYAIGHGAERVDRIGYWESPGQVMKPIYESNDVDSVKIGSKKVLAFYEGQQPNGNKTPWIMHEYKAKDAESTTVVIKSSTGVVMQLEEWVICKIYKNAEEEPAATTPPSAAATTTPSGTLTAAAAENCLNIIESTATRVEDTATRERNTSRELIAGSASATLTAAAAENRLNTIENTATRVEDTATREFIEGTDICYDPDNGDFWLSGKCHGKIFKGAEE